MSPSPSLRRRLATRVGAFALVFGVGLGLEAELGGALASGFVELAQASIGGLRFGRGGRAKFERAPNRRATQDAAGSWDTRVELSIEGVFARHRVALNPRRLAYLPCIFFVACIGTAPLPLGRKASCVLFGLALLALLALASLWIIVAWIFAQVPGLVYDLSPLQRFALNLGYEGFVTPIGNKFVIPVVLAVLLVTLHTNPNQRVKLG